jgi:hypothetical protein
MQTMRDRADFIARYGNTVAVVLGNPTTADYVIQDLDACPIDAAMQEDFTRRGLGYVATFGLIDGKFQQHYAGPLPADVIVGLAENYARLVLYKIANPKKPSGDGVEWLSRLYELPDTRQEN